MEKLTTALRVALCALAYSAIQAALGLALPMSPEFSAVPENERWMALPALFLVGLVYSAILLYYCRRSPMGSPALAALAGLVLFAVGTFQSQIETWYFRKAFPIITDRDLALLFVHGFLTAGLFAPAAVLILRGRAFHARGRVPRAGGRGAEAAAAVDRDFAFERRWWRYLLAALAYLPFYFGFGMLAQLAPVLGATYAPWIADESLLALLPFWQLLRGALFMGLGVLLTSLFSKRSHAAFALSVSFSLFISASLAFPSIIMPAALRAVHFCEITSSMILYALAVVALLTRRKAKA
jgi:hypothetical protein